MPVTVDAVTTKTGGAAPPWPASLSWTHVTSGDGRLLIVIAQWLEQSASTDGVSITGVTYAGIALNFLCSAGAAGEAWYLVDPPVGSASVVVTWDGDPLSAGTDGLFNSVGFNGSTGEIRNLNVSGPQSTRDIQFDQPCTGEDNLIFSFANQPFDQNSDPQIIPAMWVSLQRSGFRMGRREWRFGPTSTWDGNSAPLARSRMPNPSIPRAITGGGSATPAMTNWWHNFFGSIPFAGGGGGATQPSQMDGVVTVGYTRRLPLRPALLATMEIVGMNSPSLPMPMPLELSGRRLFLRGRRASRFLFPTPQFDPNAPIEEEFGTLYPIASRFASWRKPLVARNRYVGQRLALNYSGYHEAPGVQQEGGDLYLVPWAAPRRALFRRGGRSASALLRTWAHEPLAFEEQQGGDLYLIPWAAPRRALARRGYRSPSSLIRSAAHEPFAFEEQEGGDLYLVPWSTPRRAFSRRGMRSASSLLLRNYAHDPNAFEEQEGGDVYPTALQAIRRGLWARGRRAASSLLLRNYAQDPDAFEEQEGGDLYLPPWAGPRRALARRGLRGLSALLLRSWAHDPIAFEEQEGGDVYPTPWALPRLQAVRRGLRGPSQLLLRSWGEDTGAPEEEEVGDLYLIPWAAPRRAFSRRGIRGPSQLLIRAWSSDPDAPEEQEGGDVYPTALQAIRQALWRRGRRGGLSLLVRSGSHELAAEEDFSEAPDFFPGDLVHALSRRGLRGRRALGLQPHFIFEPEPVFEAESPPQDPVWGDLVNAARRRMFRGFSVRFVLQSRQGQEEAEAPAGPGPPVFRHVKGPYVRSELRDREGIRRKRCP